MTLDGILLVDKEPGWTSHDVVAKARGITGQRKIGHTGTLDPMATGLLVLALGKATRLVEYMSGHEKEYEGVFTLGVATGTDDAEGEILREQAPPPLADEDLRRLERQFTGNILQRPPAFSAIKIEGQRAYAVARRGGAVTLEERPVAIHALSLDPLPGDRLAVRVRCGAGTYIRSLARDIGEVLGCGAHLSALRRTRVGSFTIAAAVSLVDLAEATSAGLLPALLRAPDEGIGDHDAAIIATERARQLCCGGALAPLVAPARAATVARAYATDGAFLGVVYVEPDGLIRPIKVLAS